MAQQAADQRTERRVNRRVRLHTKVSWNTRTNFYTGLTRNLSEGGLFVATYYSWPQGTELDVEFTLPDDRAPIRAVAEVRWSVEHDAFGDATPGLGLRFVELRPLDQARIERFVQRRETLYFE